MKRCILICAVLVSACDKTPSEENCRYAEAIRHCIVDQYCNPSKEEVASMNRYEEKCKAMIAAGIKPQPR